MRGGVFVCHSGQDAGTAQRVVAALEAAGVPCWIAPRDIHPGESYPDAILDGIDAAPAMVLLFSAATNASPHVTRELEVAVGRSIPIVPVRLEAVEPSRKLRYFIGDSQWLDTDGVGADQWEPPLVRAVRRASADGERTRTRQISVIRDSDPRGTTRSRRPLLLWTAAAVALVVAVVVAVVLLTRGDEEGAAEGDVPEGPDGMATVFTSMTDACEHVDEPAVAAKTEVYICRTDDYYVRYSRWEKDYDRYGFFTSAIDPEPKTWLVQREDVGWQWTYEEPDDQFRPYHWSATYEDLPFSVDVEAVTANALKQGIAVVRAAAPDDIDRR
jgi:hypothetical protein